MKALKRRVLLEAERHLIVRTEARSTLLAKLLATIILASIHSITLLAIGVTVTIALQ
jgi:hypothetical protein